MYFTYVVRPGEAPESRGPTFGLFWEVFSSYCLRVSFLFQVAAYVGMLCCCATGGTSPFTLLAFLRAQPDPGGNASRGAVLSTTSLWILGGLFLLAFVNMTDDDGSIKQSRGFRGGTKLILQGAQLALVGWTLTLISFWAANTFFDTPWLQRELASGSGWLLFFAGRLSDALSLLLIGVGIFFLEVFHSDGAGEAWGWLCVLSYKAAFVAEIIGLSMFQSDGFETADMVYTILLGVSVLFGAIWAFFFEPVVHRYDVKLTQSAMRNEYYKSRNAMAYYGPAVVTADGQIDMEAAAQQAKGICCD